MGNDDTITITIDTDLEDSFYDPQFTISPVVYSVDAYESSVLAFGDLEEQELRSKHSDLNDAYEAYQSLLQKYKFWKNVTQ